MNPYIALEDQSNTILCCFIRHGKTLGNLNRRYIGVTDESLCTEGIHELNSLKAQNIYPQASILYVSPLKRCIETAHLLYPHHTILPCTSLKECNFGEFENKNHIELNNNPNYQNWVNSNGTLPFPNGEDRNDFIKRCTSGFRECINHFRQTQLFTVCDATPINLVTFIVHGGTIMSILSEFTSSKKAYFDFQVENGHGYLCRYNFNTQKLTILKSI